MAKALLDRPVRDLGNLPGNLYGSEVRLGDGDRDPAGALEIGR